MSLIQLSQAIPISNPLIRLDFQPIKVKNAFLINLNSDENKLQNLSFMSSLDGAINTLAVKAGFEDSNPLPQSSMSFQQLVEQQGFKYEFHTAQTSDGYNLGMQRIRLPSTPNGSKVVLLQHGLISQADTWIDNDPKVAVAF